MRYDGEWNVDHDALQAAVTPRTRALVVVSPGNPTGAILSLEDLAFLERTCAEHGLALVADEVFADSARVPPPSVVSASTCLAFQLSGLSKTCGLPQIKAGWIAAAGPGELTSRALSRLEVIADTNLSVSAVAQLALPALLSRRETFLSPLRERLASNRFAIQNAWKEGAPWTLLRSGGGWSAVIQVGESIDEEATCLALLDEGVVVQPGFFYDFERNGYIVVSLLPEPDLFREGLARMEHLLDQSFQSFS
jgi:aspartate/methionine/tyrosine aminotransferase